MKEIFLLSHTCKEYKTDEENKKGCQISPLKIEKQLVNNENEK